VVTPLNQFEARMLVASPYSEIELTVTHTNSRSQFQPLEAVIKVLPKDGVIGCGRCGSFRQYSFLTKGIGIGLGGTIKEEAEYI
jgi:hypothetical protein